MARPTPERRSRATRIIVERERDERQVVVRALAREVDRADHRPLHEHRSAADAAREERPLEDVLLRGERERERDDGEQQAAHAQRAGADERGDERAHDRHDDERERGRELRQIDVDAVRAVAEPERVAVDQRGEAERADPGERGLAERDLTGPAGEHDERQRDDREQQHVRVQEVPRRRGDHERHGDRDDRARARPTSRGSVRTHQIARSRSGIGLLRGANENDASSSAIRARGRSATSRSARR